MWAGALDPHFIRQFQDWELDGVQSLLRHVQELGRHNGCEAEWNQEANKSGI